MARPSTFVALCLAAAASACTGSSAPTAPAEEYPFRVVALSPGVGETLPRGAAASVSLTVASEAPGLLTLSLRDQSGDFGLGIGGLTKDGPGTMLLTSVNTYTGPTVINAGTLLVNGSIAASSLVTVNSGAILGGSGYTALELFRLLRRHPQADVVAVTSRSEDAPLLAELHPSLYRQTDLRCEPFNADRLIKKGVECAFGCLPHGVSMSTLPALLQRGVRVIDLSADYRLRDPNVYAQWYGESHFDLAYLAQAVYGLPEIYGEDTLADVEERCETVASSLGLEVTCHQSNSEGDIIEMIHEAQGKYDGLIINAAGYTHTSVAIFDALSILTIPVVEVHISNIYKREEFRHKSLISPAATGIICGFGVKGYELALKSFL